MSVINRMLEDLERRQEDPAAGERERMPPESVRAPGAGRGRLLIVAAALGVVLLVIVIVALGWRAADGLSPARPEPGAAAPPEQAPPQDAGRPADAAATAEAQEEPAETPDPAVLRETDTLIKPYGARIAMTFDRPLDDLPVVRHENRRTNFWLPGARLDGNTLAFLAGLRQAGRVESTTDAEGAGLSIEPAKGTRLDVEADRYGIVLAFTSSGPASPVAARTSSSGDDAGEAADEGERAPAASDTEGPSADTRPKASPESAPAAEQPADSGDDRGADAEAEPPSMGIRPASASVLRQVRERISQGDVAGARERLEAALSRDSSRQDLRRLLAKLDMQEGEVDRAVARLGALDRPEPASLALLGLAARRADQPDVAVQAYGKALEARPHRAEWWAGLGIAMESMGRPDGAGSAYRRAMNEGGLSRELGNYIRQRLAALGTAASDAD